MILGIILRDQTDANIKVVADDLANNYYNKSQVDSKFTSVYIFKGSVDRLKIYLLRVMSLVMYGIFVK